MRKAVALAVISILSVPQLSGFSQEDKVDCACSECLCSSWAYHMGMTLKLNDPSVVESSYDWIASHGVLGAGVALLKWIQEPNPQIRRYILEAYSKLGDGMFIRDGDFPKMWFDASNRFQEPERSQRLDELRKYWPELIKGLESKEKSQNQ